MNMHSVTNIVKLLAKCMIRKLTVVFYLMLHILLHISIMQIHKCLFTQDK